MNVNYEHLKTDEADAQALADIQKALPVESWQALVAMAEDPVIPLKALNTTFAFAGIQGFGFHAFCRKYRLADYRTWLVENGVATDDKGWSYDDHCRGLSYQERVIKLEADVGKPTLEQLIELAKGHRMLPEELELWATSLAESYYDPQ